MISLLVCISMTIPVFANDVTIESDKIDQLITQNQESIEIQSQMLESTHAIVFWIKVIIFLALLTMAFFLAYLFVKKIAIKILNITTKGMSL
ncbi:hypothetical protein HZI73_22230 [Vallitalea pronyensis]|uniref:Uncharacterized protein n=1 Tax=Vallitalea pronyensis TaxID=1348613 RepID=A0A8J8SIE7_9FIRM|nr:hypothetical protein [Vallitalea pronyensis]QUI24850.1 hypothetical protein HZI73_22230 [Vallitalea pronyensis]